MKAEMMEREGRRQAPPLTEEQRGIARDCWHVVAEAQSRVKRVLPAAWHEDADGACVDAYLARVRSYRAGCGMAPLSWLRNWTAKDAMRHFLRITKAGKKAGRPRNGAAALWMRSLDAPQDFLGGTEGARHGADHRHTLAAPRRSPLARPDEMRDARELVPILLRRIPPRHGEAVRLHLVEGLLMREAAERMGLSESRVSQMLSEAMPMLREEAGRHAAVA